MNHTLPGLILSLILTLLFVTGCTAPNDAINGGSGLEPGMPDQESVGLPNPASVYCTEQGGVLEMRTDADGGQYGVCLFNDGSECEEWAFFRGECAPGNTQLFATLWVLQSYAGQTPLPGSTPTLRIERDWQLGGNTGCNSFFSSVTRDGDSWKLGEIGSTLMACIDTMEQETAILDLLRAVTHHTLTSGSLVLHTPDGDLVYGLPQNAILEGTEWTLNGIAQDDTVVSTWIDSEITIKFEDGQVNGYTGCNNFFGSYTLEGETLSLGPLGMTKRACGEEVGKREMEYVLALEQVAGYRTELNTLTLVDGNGRLLLIFTVTSQ